MYRLPSAAQGSAARGADGSSAARLIPEVSTGGLTGCDANMLLASVGFLLVPGAPFDRGDSYLLVALRPRPTLDHFDAERIEFWSPQRSACEATALEWATPPTAGQFAWGPVRIVDRLGATNCFGTFGGDLNTSRDGEKHAALFRSPAPIVALGGHSTKADAFGILVAGFLAQLRAAAGDRALDGDLVNIAPLSLYAAFLLRTLPAPSAVAQHQSRGPRLQSVLRSELCRLQRDHARDVTTGAALIGQLGLGA